jgi:hypothetical protein
MSNSKRKSKSAPPRPETSNLRIYESKKANSKRAHPLDFLEVKPKTTSKKVKNTTNKASKPKSKKDKTAQPEPGAGDSDQKPERIHGYGKAREEVKATAWEPEDWKETW